MAPFAKSVAVLTGMAPKPSEANAQKITKFLGADVERVPVAALRSIESLREALPPCSAVIVHIDTLAELAESLNTGANGLLEIAHHSFHVFVYGCDPNKRYEPILKTLSAGTLVGFKELPTTDLSFSVSREYRQQCGPFSGLKFPKAEPGRDAGFVESEPSDKKDVFIRAGGQAFFVRVKLGASDMYFAACGELGNLEEEIDSELGLLSWFSMLAPIIIFLRSALGDQLWHSDNPRACFIIDDPLLKRRYGFLNYSRLLETMEEQKFCASIAFIPWNYRRSHKEIVDLFASAPASLSLCTHGCDHTRGEFVAASYELLSHKAQLALERMRVHQERYGLRFDEVMVFPQGLFSCEALKALGDCGYLAAVNTSLCASDMVRPLTLGEIVDVAVTRFGQMPLFVRHYPRDVAEFAFDLFLGKPALLVEHHGYFRNGYEELRTFVSQVNQLDERLEWQNPATICSQACLQKATPAGEVRVRFYTNRFRLTNTGTNVRTYYLEKRWAVDGPWPGAKWNGRECPVELKDGTLSITVTLAPGESAEISVVPAGQEKPRARAWKPSNGHNTRVLVRRILSEIRDDYVETNSLLNKLLSNARKEKQFAR
jgi:hypothetical protein